MSTLVNKQRIAILIAFITLIFSADLFALSRGLTVSYKENESSSAHTAGEMQLYKKSYALVIGVDHSVDGWPGLSQAISDAKKVAAAFGEQHQVNKASRSR